MTSSIRITPELELRAANPSDCEAFFAAIESNREYFRRRDSSLADISDREAAANRVNRMIALQLEGRRTGFFIWHGSELIGGTGLHNIDRENHKAEIGYWLVDRHTGRGFASRAVAAVVSLGFGSLALNRIEARTATSNASSIKVLERVGFKREGMMRDAHYSNGRFVDDYLYAILRREGRSLD